MPRALVVRAAAALALVVAVLVGAPTAATAKQGPEIRNFSLALPYSLLNPGVSPRGADDPRCRPSAEHPRPVVLVHGTFANRFNSFAAMAPALRRAGFCVYSLNYGTTWLRGVNGMRSIRGSAAELASFVDRVRSQTGAAQVDLVGYSQGAVVSRAYLQWGGGGGAADPADNPVHALVGLSAVNHGTKLLGLTDLVDYLGLRPLLKAPLGQGPLDLIVGSPLMRELAAAGEAPPGVETTMIATRTDEVNVPYRSAYLTGSESVTNVLLQHGCPTDLSDHFNLTYSPRAIALVIRALDPSSRRRLPCGVVLPFV